MRTLSSVARAEVKQALALNIFRLAAVGTWAAEVRTDGLVPGLDRVFASNAKLQDLWSVAKMGMWDDPPRDGRQTEGQRASSLNANFTHDVAGQRQRRDAIAEYIDANQKLILALTLPRLYISNVTRADDPCYFSLSSGDAHVRSRAEFKQYDCITIIPSHGLDDYMGDKAKNYAKHPKFFTRDNACKFVVALRKSLESDEAGEASAREMYAAYGHQVRHCRCAGRCCALAYA